MCHFYCPLHTHKTLIRHAGMPHTPPNNRGQTQCPIAADSFLAALCNPCLSYWHAPARESDTPDCRPTIDRGSTPVRSGLILIPFCAWSLFRHSRSPATPESRPNGPIAADPFTLTPDVPLLHFVSYLHAPGRESDTPDCRSTRGHRSRLNVRS